MNIQLTTSPSHKKALETFHKHYGIERLIWSPGEPMIFKPEGERRCRFCSKAYPATTFKSVAHTMPEFLGNRHHASDSECDKCNHDFGRVENDLKHFLGALPTLTWTKGKKGIPNFYTPKDILTIRKSDKPNFKNGIEISKKDIESDALEINTDTGEHIFTYKKPAYIPFNVYKALLKIALSCVPDDEVANLNKAFSILNATDSREFANYIRVAKITLSFNHRKAKPHAYLFKKRQRFASIPTYMFMFCYQNLIFELPLPLYRHDTFIYKSPTPYLQFCPPLYGTEVDDDPSLKFEEIDLTSTQRKEDDKDVWRLAINDPNYKEKAATKFDPKTGEWSKVDEIPNDIVSIVIMQGDHALPLNPNKQRETL